MQYTKDELIALLELLNAQITTLVKKNQYANATILDTLRQKVQRDIDARP